MNLLAALFMVQLLFIVGVGGVQASFDSFYPKILDLLNGLLVQAFNVFTTRQYFFSFFIILLREISCTRNSVPIVLIIFNYVNV